MVTFSDSINVLYYDGYVGVEESLRGEIKREKI